MSDVASLIADLAKAGLAPDLLGRVAQAIADASSRVPPRDDAAEKRRAYDRERKRVHRKSTGQSGGQDVDVSTGHSTGIPPETPPLARVRDNLPRLVISGLIDDDDCASAQDHPDDWPKTNLVEALVEEVASPRLDHRKSPGLVQTSGQLAAWKRDGASWEHDVLPVVKALCAKARDPVKTWRYFAPAIAQSIADNRAALAIPEARQATGPPGQSITERISAENAEARRRAFELMDQRAAKNG